MHARSFPKSFHGLVRLYTTDHLSRGTPLTKTRFTNRHVRIASAASACDRRRGFDQCVCVNSVIDSKRQTHRSDVVVVNLCRVRVRASIASSIVHSADDEDDAFLVRLLVVVAFSWWFHSKRRDDEDKRQRIIMIILRAVVLRGESHHSIDRLTRECVSD